MVAGGWLLARSGAAASAASRNLGALSLGLLAYAAAVELVANGFVAAFAAGLAYGMVERRAKTGSSEKTLALKHQGAELLSLIVWFFFGAERWTSAADQLGSKSVPACRSAIEMVDTLLRASPQEAAFAAVMFLRSIGRRGRVLTGRPNHGCERC